MIVTETELAILYCLSHGVDDVAGISEQGKVDAESIEGAVASMKRKGLLDRRGGIAIAPNPFAVRLQHIMGLSIGRANCLSGHALDILAALREPKSVGELMAETGLPEEIILGHLKALGATGAVCEVPQGYEINSRMWIGLRKMLDSMEDYQEVIDSRVPCGVEIYSVSDEAVVYSSDIGGPGQRTAFSVFRDYGDRSIYTTEYLTTYEGEMDLNRAFADAYAATEVLQDHRLRSGLISVYVRNKGSFEPPEGFLEVYQRLEAGERIFRWPNLEEVMANIREGL